MVGPLELFSERILLPQWYALFFKHQTPRGERWFPSTPSKIQIGVWDGGSSENEGTKRWAGGPINWGDETSYYATYKSIDIQCYDDNDTSVASWPPQPEGVSIDFPAGNQTVNGSSIPTIDRTGRVRSANGGSIASISFAALLTILLFSIQMKNFLVELLSLFCPIDFRVVGMQLVLSTTILVVYAASQGMKDPITSGNCISGLINFNPARIIYNPFNTQNIDPTIYDFSIDYSPSNVLVRFEFNSQDTS